MDILTDYLHHMFCACAVKVFPSLEYVKIEAKGKPSLITKHNFEKSRV